MKKMITLLAAAILASGLAACGSPQEHGGAAETAQPGPTQEESAGVDISLWAYPVGNWGNPASVAGLLSKFRKQYPDIHLSVKYLKYTDGDDKIEAAIKDGQAPDLVFEGPERIVADWGRRGLMADLSGLLEEEPAQEIYGSVRHACQGSDGRYLEFPICMTTHCMAVNRDMFQEADALQYLDEEKHTWTTDGFIQAVEALRAHGQKNVGVIYCGGQVGDQGTRALVNNLYGGTFTDKAHTTYTFNSPENIQALELLHSMEGIRFDPAIVGDDEIAQFSAGNLAMAFCWNVAVEISQTVSNPAMDFDILPMAFPADEGTPRLQGGIWGFGVFDNGDPARIEAAKTFIRFMTQDDRQYEEAVLVSSHWPVRRISGIYANDELRTEYRIFLQYMKDYYQVTPGWSQARTAWWKMLQQVGSGEDIAASAETFNATANTAAQNQKD